MASPTAYAMLCVDLGFVPENVPDALKGLLQLKLEAAEGELRDAGVVIDTSCGRDLDLLVMYADWLYRGRQSKSDMPLALSRLLRNRQVAGATGGRL